MPDPSNEFEYNTPIILAETLNNRRLEIQEKIIPRLDPESFVTIKELPLEIPAFDVLPSLIENTTVAISLNSSFTFCGNVYSIAIVREGSENTTGKVELYSK
jgi:hypothetical protein